MLTNAAKTSNLEGIYTIAEDKLTYCIAGTGLPRPTDFSVTKESKRTLISLEGFPPGEHQIESTLKHSGAIVGKDAEAGVADRGTAALPN